jgi:hypothetical protein
MHSADLKTSTSARTIKLDDGQKASHALTNISRLSLVSSL